MYARVTTVDGGADRIDRGIAFVHETVEPLIEELPGSLGLIMMVDRERGRVMVGTAWDTAEARAASDKELSPIRDEAGRILSGEARAMDMEFVVTEQVKPQQPGYWARTTRLTVPVDRLDDSIDEFRSRVLPAVRELNGFCTAVLLVNRERGKAQATTTWDSREALEASRGPVAPLREGTAQRTSATVDDVFESEIVIAGMHPEMWIQRVIQLPSEERV